MTREIIRYLMSHSEGNLSRSTTLVSMVSPMAQKDVIMAQRAKALAVKKAHCPRASPQARVTTWLTLSGPCIPRAAMGTTASSMPVMNIPVIIALGR